eukprot:1803784-Lingulodinium_polyedra.AAC.1
MAEDRKAVHTMPLHEGAIKPMKRYIEAVAADQQFEWTSAVRDQLEFFSGLDPGSASDAAALAAFRNQ